MGKGLGGIGCEGGSQTPPPLLSQPPCVGIWLQIYPLESYRGVQVTPTGTPINKYHPIIRLCINTDNPWEPSLWGWSPWGGYSPIWAAFTPGTRGCGRWTSSNFRVTPPSPNPPSLPPRVKGQFFPSYAIPNSCLLLLVYKIQ